MVRLNLKTDICQLAQIPLAMTRTTLIWTTSPITLSAMSCVRWPRSPRPDLNNGRSPCATTACFLPLLLALLYLRNTGTHLITRLLRKIGLSVGLKWWKLRSLRRFDVIPPKNTPYFYLFFNFWVASLFCTICSVFFCPFLPIFWTPRMFSPLILFLIILVCVLLLLGGHGIYMYQPPPVGWYPPKNIFSQTLVLSSVFSLHLRFRSVERSSLYTLLSVTTFPPLFCVSYLTWTYWYIHTLLCVLCCVAL